MSDARVQKRGLRPTGEWLEMKFFVDTADVDEIRALVPTGLLLRVLDTCKAAGADAVDVAAIKR